MSRSTAGGGPAGLLIAPRLARHFIASRTARSRKGGFAGFGESIARHDRTAADRRRAIAAHRRSWKASGAERRIPHG